jgi:hypothetical protein
MKHYIIVFVAPENACLCTKIEIKSRMEAEILIFIWFYMAAIVEIQDVCHRGANNYLVITSEARGEASRIASFMVTRTSKDNSRIQEIY